jgi:mannosyltransferase OCH1-like enzyme
MGDKSSDFIDRSTLSPEPIPKIIYSTWISDKPLPEKFLKYIESWQRVMPDYRIEIISMKNKPESDFINRCIERKMFVVA